MATVTYDEIDLSLPKTASVSATATVLSYSRLGQNRRSSFSIIPLTAGVTVTVVKGELEQAVANGGIVLTANQPYVESDSEGFRCWQGTICVVANGAGSVAYTEVIKRD